MSKLTLPPLYDKRGHTSEIWDDMLETAFSDNPYHGLGVTLDFNGGLDGWTQTALNSASSTMAVIDGLGGVVSIDPGATTQHHGRQAQYGKACYKVSSSGVLAFETLFKLPLNSVEPFFFLGLCVTDTTILGASSLLTADGIGFVVSNADGHVDFVARNTSDTVKEVLSTPLTADTWYHLGFIVNRSGPAIPFVNCVKQGADKQIANSALPTSLMAPSIAFTGQGTIQPTLQVDWVKVGMELVSSVR